MDTQAGKAIDCTTTASAVFCGTWAQTLNFEKNYEPGTYLIPLFGNEITLERLSNFFSNFAIVSPDSY